VWPILLVVQDCRQTKRLVPYTRPFTRARDLVDPYTPDSGSVSVGGMYRLMLLGRAAPVVNARLPLTEACAHGLRGLWPEAEDCHRQHRHRIGVHNSHAGGSGA